MAVAFSLLNSFLRPILRILTFPITLVTLGLFLIVINAAMLMLTGAISDQLELGFAVQDFWAALLGSVVISIVGWILSMVVGASRMPSTRPLTPVAASCAAGAFVLAWPWRSRSPAR